MVISEIRKRPPNGEPDAPRPPYVKEPEPDVPDNDEQVGDLVPNVQTLARSFQPCA